MFVAPTPQPVALPADPPPTREGREPSPLVPARVIFSLAGANFSDALELIGRDRDAPAPGMHEARLAVEHVVRGESLVRSAFVPGMSPGALRVAERTLAHAAFGLEALETWATVAELASEPGDRTLRDRSLRGARAAIGAAALLMDAAARGNRGLPADPAAPARVAHAPAPG